MNRLLLASIAASVCFLPASVLADPTRAPAKGCAWEKLSDAGLGLEAWVQRCDYGLRKISFYAKQNALMVRWSDGTDDSSVIEVFDLRGGESAEAGIRRVFREHTKDEVLVKHCVLRLERGPMPKGVRRYTFVADATLRKKLSPVADADVPDPPCGDWGFAPDGIQYFESQVGAHRVMFIRVGQDEPLFDEATLRLLPRRSQ